jgi:molybdate transport system regulatory protein
MLLVGKLTVSRQGIAFDYSSPAELYLSRRRGRHTDYRRFATAAEAIHYAVEELRTRRYRSARMQVGDELFNKKEINRLYYPLSKSLIAAPVGPHGTDVSTQLSVRIDLVNGGHLGSGKIALLEAIQAQKSISGAARSLGITRNCAIVWVRAINNALCGPAVATEGGGKGGAALTPLGAELVGLYRVIEAQAQAAAIVERGALQRLARSEKMQA